MVVESCCLNLLRSSVCELMVKERRERMEMRSGGRHYIDDMKSGFSSMETDGYFEISTLPP